MRIISIVPGPSESAICELISGQPKGYDCVENNDLVLKIERARKLELYDRLYVQNISMWGRERRGHNLIQIWTGRFLQAGLYQGQIMGGHLIYSYDVKSHLCNGDKQTTDSTVRQALINRFGAPSTKKNPGLLYGMRHDMWQALGVAITAYETRQTN